MSLEHILLGLLQRPGSGYDLKATFDGTVRHFWAAELSQIYTTLQRMERTGLLKSRVEPSAKGPARKVYSVAPTGRRALRAWLTDAPKVNDQRYTYLAQLFFMDSLSSLDQTLAFTTSLRETRADALKTFRAIERQWLDEADGSVDDMSDENFHQYVTLRAGIHTMAARLRWCDETIRMIKQRADRQRNGRGQRKGNTR